MNREQFVRIYDFAKHYNHLWASDYASHVDAWLEKTDLELRGDEFEEKLSVFLSSLQDICLQDEWGGICPVDSFRVAHRKDGSVYHIEYSHTSGSGRLHVNITSYSEVFEIHRPDELGGHCVLKGGRKNWDDGSFNLQVIALGEHEDRHVLALWDAMYAYYGEYTMVIDDAFELAEITYPAEPVPASTAWEQEVCTQCETIQSDEQYCR